MKGREKEALRNMSVEELAAKLRETEQSYFQLQFRHATNPLKNPTQIRQRRREIACLKTWLHAKTQGGA